MSPDEIRHFAEVDVLLLPAFFGLHHNDRRLLSAAWDCTKGAKFQTGLKRKGRKALNQMLGCDIRPEKETCSTT